jgi:hypothetical protein
MHYPKNLRATASSNYILSLYGGSSNGRLFAIIPTDERRSKNMTCIRSVLFQSIPQPTKSPSEKPTRSSEEEAEYQIPNSRICLRYLNIC